MSALNYKSAGVDYDVLDTFKRACQRAASTVANLANDLCAVGALPVSIAMYAAVGDKNNPCRISAGQL